MEIYVRVKALGRPRDILAPIPYTIPDGVSSLRLLLTAIVQQEVANFNSRGTETQLIPYLTQQALEAQSQTGKISFGRLYSDKKADPQKAVANALQCWEDGLIRVFMNEEELTEPDAPLVVPNGAVFTFIRLTFLAGSMW